MDLVSDYDILFIQEHHLFKFEADSGILDDLFHGYRTDNKCFDETMDLEISQRPTHGYHGVATVWKEELDPYIRASKEGNERILVTLYEPPGERPFCFINGYLPSGNSPDALRGFLEACDIIHEIINKYTNHEIVLTGDLNEDHYHRNTYKEILIKRIIEEYEMLDLGTTTADTCTYINEHLGHKSRLDHILVKTIHPENWSEATVMERSDTRLSLNTSKHVPIHGTLKIGRKECTSMPKTTPTATQITTKRYKMKEWDRGCYKNTISQELCDKHLELLDPHYAVVVFQSCMETAMTASAPVIRQTTLNKKKSTSAKGTPELLAAVAVAKEKFSLWKEAGSPVGHDYPEYTQKNVAHQAVKRIIRNQRFQDHAMLLKEVGEATSNDQALLAKLVKIQKEGKVRNGTLLVDDRHITNDDDIREQWAAYFTNLGTPKVKDEYLADLLEKARCIVNSQSDSLIIDNDFVREAVQSLNSGKAADIFGVTAEQLKALPDTGMSSLTCILNNIINSRTVPEILKEAFKITIPKKGKDARIQDNHRGITIAPIIGKVLEKICLLYDVADLPQNDLQFGFTAGRSPSMCSLIITEAIAEAKTLKIPLITATEDARKAFDVVSHEILKLKLFHTNIHPRIWNLIDSLYQNGSERIRYMGAYSSTYAVLQGVKQGGGLSPDLYKWYIFELLESLKEDKIGLHIGNIYLGTPTCADDVFFMSNEPTGNEMQAMLNVSVNYSSAHRWEIHPTKSTTTILHDTKDIERRAWTLGNKVMPTVNEFPHLGLTWRASKSQPDIDEIISTTRRCSYKLLGIGVHGGNGLNPCHSSKILNTYVWSVMLSGTEALVLRRADMDKLEDFYRSTLRRIQNLPQSTANCAVYLLIGVIPVEGLIHLRMLTLFGNITRLGERHPLRELALRQLALARPHSWFCHLHKIAELYKINITHALISPWKKEHWKEHCRTAVRCHWHRTLLSESYQRTTLRSLIFDHKQIKPHGCWSACGVYPHLVPAAVTRMRLMTGRAGLKQASWRKDTTCPLCKKEDETLEHFLVLCPKLEDHRQDISRLRVLYVEDNNRPPWNTEELASALMNGDCYRSCEPSLEVISLTDARKDIAQNLCSSICLKLYKERDYLLSPSTM